MSGRYKIPARSFDPNIWAVNKTLSSNQFVESTVSRFTLQYEKFWDIGVGESGRTQNRFQRILNELGTDAGEIIADYDAYASYIDVSVSGGISTVYQSGAYPYVLVSGTAVQLTGGLHQHWLDEIDSRNNPQ